MGKRKLSDDQIDALYAELAADPEFMEEQFLHREKFRLHRELIKNAA